MFIFGQQRNMPQESTDTVQLLKEIMFIKNGRINVHARYCHCNVPHFFHVENFVYRTWHECSISRPFEYEIWERRRKRKHLSRASLIWDYLWKNCEILLFFPWCQICPSFSEGKEKSFKKLKDRKIMPRMHANNIKNQIDQAPLRVDLNSNPLSSGVSTASFQILICHRRKL